MAVDTFYGDWVIRLERGVMLGALAMIIWPLANHAFVASSSVLYGAEARSTYVMLAPFFSALFGLWALMILFYFYRKAERDTEGAGKALGVHHQRAHRAQLSRHHQLLGAIYRRGSRVGGVAYPAALLLLATSGSELPQRSPNAPHFRPWAGIRAYGDPYAIAGGQSP